MPRDAKTRTLRAQLNLNTPPVHIRLNESAVYYTVFSEVQPFAIEQLFTPSLYGFELSLS